MNVINPHIFQGGNIESLTLISRHTWTNFLANEVFPIDRFTRNGFHSFFRLSEIISIKYANRFP
jgi:hypothetical protein